MPVNGLVGPDGLAQSVAHWDRPIPISELTKIENPSSIDTHPYVQSDELYDATTLGKVSKSINQSVELSSDQWEVEFENLAHLNFFFANISFFLVQIKCWKL